MLVLSIVFFAFLAGVFWIGVALWFVAAFRLRGPDLSAFDQPSGERFSNGPQPSAELQAALASLARIGEAVRRVPRRQRTAALREAMDQLSAGRRFDASFTPVDCGGVPGEWVLAPGADGTRRTLYIHGGAYAVGSPRSHRTLTSSFSAITGGAVLAIDYRLMPEHPRIAGIEDCRRAYRWMLENGPAGAQPARTVFVAGDSAGGNLTLSLIAWLRDQGLRAPDAAVALSPATDSTGASPSLKSNLHSDPMLGPLFAPLTKVPHPLLLWFGWLQNRINPRDPMISPVYGDLSRLPPVLVQVSQVEMLRDDGRRYVNRACAAGSPARLQTWDHMVHVWQIFNPELPEARAALEEIRKFLAPHQARLTAAPASRA
ncbi:MAG TPA: alpha/beta hydrolase [Burkholderiaceae bacterium]|nr:alpha/beta hydrolase [Burkholderiaceae bacterium]